MKKSTYSNKVAKIIKSARNAPAAALVKKSDYGPNFNPKTGVTKIPGIKFKTAKLTKAKLKNSKYSSDGVGVGGN